jgi:hypothetical protein
MCSANEFLDQKKELSPMQIKNYYISEYNKNVETIDL